MAMNRIVTYIEAHDGTEYGPFRVTHRHRARWEKTCKARGFDPEGAQADELLAWIVSSGVEGTPFHGLDKKAWDELVFDATNQRADAGEGKPDEWADAEQLDPTRQEASTTS